MRNDAAQLNEFMTGDGPKAGKNDMNQSRISRPSRNAFKVRGLPRALATAFGLAGALLATGCAAPNADVAQIRKVIKERGSGSLLRFAEDAATRGDHAAAIPMFRRAHQSESGSAAPLIGLGRSLAAIGQYRAAADAFAEAIDKDDQAAAAYRGLGNSQLVLGQYANAVANFSQAARLEPGNAANYSGLGIAFDASGNHAEALRSFREGLAQAGGTSLRGNYGLSLALHGDRMGIDVLEDTVRQADSGARERVNLALAYALFGDYRRAATMASIDLDVGAARANLVFASTLRGLDPRARTVAMLQGSAAPKTDTREPANRGQGNADETQVRATIARLLPEPQATAPTPQPETDPAVLAGAPPLLEPEGWAVQIAAYRKLEHLTPGWRFLSVKYADLIGHLEPRRSEVDHPHSPQGPSGFFYRLNAGPLTGRAEANGICQALQARGGECWVRAPEPAEGRLPGDQDRDAERALIGSADHEAVMKQLAEQAMAPNVPQAASEPEPIAEAPAKAASIADLSPYVVAASSDRQVSLALNPVAPEAAMAALQPHLVQNRANRAHALTLAPVAADAAMVALRPHLVAQRSDRGETLGLAPIPATAAMQPLTPLLVATQTPGQRQQALPLSPAEAVLAGATDEAKITLQPVDLPQLGDTNPDPAETEVLPANFGQDGRAALGSERPAARTISAFEEAEAWMAQEAQATAPTLKPVEPSKNAVRADQQSLQRSGAPLSPLDQSGSEKPDTKSEEG
ncbi:MAG: hypothetical protein Tsb0016_22970 [Sphingomonadales bacterium]